MYEEAEKISLGLVEGYRFGFFVMIGMIAALAVILFLCWAKRCRTGTAPMLMLFSILFGAVVSRVVFCLLNQELGGMMPIASWLNIAGGGWSMMGLVGGVMLGAFVTAKCTGEKISVMMDIAACALPVFMVMERIGESCVEDFDYSRQLTSGVLDGTFLASSNYDGAYLDTWKLAAIVMGVLFIILMVDMTRSERDGDTACLFLMLFGAVSVILESLRYDRFLSISFVGLQQIIAAVILLIGVWVLTGKADRSKKKLGAVAVISCFLAAGIGVGLEFALDRTTVSPLIIYIAFVIVMAVPVVLGMMLKRRER